MRDAFTRKGIFYQRSTIAVVSFDGSDPVGPTDPNGARAAKSGRAAATRPPASRPPRVAATLARIAAVVSAL